MGALDDFGRLMKATSKTPRPTLSQSIKQAADAAEAAEQWRTQGVPAANGVSANPFENLAAMNSMARGSGTVVSMTDTGEKQADASIYSVVFDVVADGHAPFQATHRQLISAAALGNWQPGKVLPLRFDPANPTEVMIG